MKGDLDVVTEGLGLAGSHSQRLAQAPQPVLGEGKNGLSLYVRDLRKLVKRPEQLS